MILPIMFLLTLIPDLNKLAVFSFFAQVIQNKDTKFATFNTGATTLSITTTMGLIMNIGIILKKTA